MYITIFSFLGVVVVSIAIAVAVAIIFRGLKGNATKKRPKNDVKMQTKKKPKGKINTVYENPSALQSGKTGVYEDPKDIPL